MARGFLFDNAALMMKWNHFEATTLRFHTDSAENDAKMTEAVRVIKQKLRDFYDRSLSLHDSIWASFRSKKRIARYVRESLGVLADMLP